jgi:hypothetical protein
MFVPVTDENLFTFNARAAQSENTDVPLFVVAAKSKRCGLWVFQFAYRIPSIQETHSSSIWRSFLLQVRLISEFSETRLSSFRFSSLHGIN